MQEQKLVKGQQISLSLTSWGRLGEATGQWEETDVFVTGGIPGEKVVAEVVRVHRKYAAAAVVEVLEPSEFRVEPPCPYYGVCSGCQWQHVDYHHQLTVKQEKVADALRRVGDIADPPVSPVTPSPIHYGYRNHARFTISREGDLGFVNRQTRQFVRIDSCMLMHDGINGPLAELQGKCAETSQLSIRSGEKTGDTLVQPTLINPDIPLISGQKFYEDSIDGHTFRVSSPSFFQVNVEQTVQVVQVIRQALDAKETDVLLDAYCGVGTFAVLMAPYVRKVIAIEESSAAVSDARLNTGGVANIELVLGKTEDVLSTLSEKPDVAILDPPRAGCHPRTIETLIELAPPKIAYVSCDAETLGRDLKLLCESAYTLRQVVPLDMFPQTHHVECVALLTRNDSANQLILASGSPRRRELLTGAGMDFRVVPSDIPEDPLPGEPPAKMAERLSLEKAQAVAARFKDGFVVAADSMVVHDGRAYGKPEDADDARRMLRELRNTRHQVVTGITVIDVAGGRVLTDSLASDVVIRDFSDAEIDSSIATGTPMDKAGAYAVQDEDFRPAESWAGCYTNIIGLPMCRLGQMLTELGFDGTLGEPIAGSPECGPTCPHRSSDIP